MRIRGLVSELFEEKHVLLLLLLLLLLFVVVVVVVVVVIRVQEGPRDAGKKTDWDFKVGGPSYCENKNG